MSDGKQVTVVDLALHAAEIRDAGPLDQWIERLDAEMPGWLPKFTVLEEHIEIPAAPETPTAGLFRGKHIHGRDEHLGAWLGEQVAPAPAGRTISLKVEGRRSVGSLALFYMLKTGREGVNMGWSAKQINDLLEAYIRGENTVFAPDRGPVFPVVTREGLPTGRLMIRGTDNKFTVWIDPMQDPNACGENPEVHFRGG